MKEVTLDNCYDYDEYRRIDRDMKRLLSLLIGDFCAADTKEGNVTFYLQEVCYDLYLDFDEALQTLGEENIDQSIANHEGYLITDTQLMKLLSISPLQTARKLYAFLKDTSETLREGITE